MAVPFKTLSTKPIALSGVFAPVNYVHISPFWLNLAKRGGRYWASRSPRLRKRGEAPLFSYSVFTFGRTCPRDRCPRTPYNRVSSYHLGCSHRIRGTADKRASQNPPGQAHRRSYRLNPLVAYYPLSRERGGPPWSPSFFRLPLNIQRHH